MLDQKSQIPRLISIPYSLYLCIHTEFYIYYSEGLVSGSVESTDSISFRNSGDKFGGIFKSRSTMRCMVICSVMEGSLG
jgi:hypothetical protein